MYAGKTQLWKVVFQCCAAVRHKLDPAWVLRWFTTILSEESAPITTDSNAAIMHSMIGNTLFSGYVKNNWTMKRSAVGLSCMQLYYEESRFIVELPAVYC